MKIKLLTLSVIGLCVAVLLPAIAISQNQNKTFCQQLNDLRAQSLSDVVAQFQDGDSLADATALLRQTRTNPAAAARFDSALARLRIDPVHQALQSEISTLEKSPRARNCAGFAKTRFIAPQDYPDQ